MAIKPGIYAASMSIFDKNLVLNPDLTIDHAVNLLNEGCTGVAILGSTGQSQLISMKEKIQLIDKLSQQKYKNQFLIGTGENSLNHNIEIIKHCLKNGLNRFLIMPPAYYKYTDDGVYTFFSKIIQKAPEIEIILYNFEKLSGYKFSITLIEKLVHNFPKQIVGVKDSTYNLYETIKIPNFSVFPGSESKLVKGLELGCSGIISAVCNVTAPLAAKVYEDFKNKKKQTLNNKLCAVRSVFDNYNLISALHSFMSNENEEYKRVLPPLNLLTEKENEELLHKLEKLDFFPDKSKAA
ncbi:MAG: 4-hydroxy-tetrahydrodipicolinate synthase [Pelagibacterales bacterium]|nr:4-hydroxy-tetrahydrodipicolinate synthase [Pelagibacterales bacterium]